MTKSPTVVQTIASIQYLRRFISIPQIETMAEGLRGEEGEFFRAKFIEMASLIQAMPKTYEQDGKGDEAIVSLHYFSGSMDWYITEKDKGYNEVEGAQHQAFGYADFGDHNAELGYISILALIQNKVELDLYFVPKPLGKVKKLRDDKTATRSIVSAASGVIFD